MTAYLPYVGANLVFALNPGDHKDRPYGILRDKLGRILQRFKSFCAFHKHLGYITMRGTIPKCRYIIRLNSDPQLFTFFVNLFLYPFIIIFRKVGELPLEGEVFLHWLSLFRLIGDV